MSQPTSAQYGRRLLRANSSEVDDAFEMLRRDQESDTETEDNSEASVETQAMTYHGWRSSACVGKLQHDILDISTMALTNEDLAIEIFHHVPHRRDLVAAWQARAEQRASAPIRVATLMSGTDAPMRAFELDVDVLNSQLPPRAMKMHVLQVLACDIGKAQRTFCYINKRSDHLLVFHDAKDVATKLVADEGGVADDAVQQVTVPRNADLLWSSFSCTSVSFENAKRRKFTSGIQNKESDETAETFEATVEYFANSSLKIGVSENVLGLVRGKGVNDGDAVVQSDTDKDVVSDAAEAEEDGPSCQGQSEAMYKRFREIGCEVVNVELENTTFLSKSRRNRVFFIYAHPDRLNVSQADVRRRLTQVKYTLICMSKSIADAQLDVDLVLLPEGHWRIELEADKLARRFAAALEVESSLPHLKHINVVKDPAWIEHSRKEWEASGLPWREVPNHAKRRGFIGKIGLRPELEETGSDTFNPFYACLPASEKYNLELITHKFPLPPLDSEASTNTFSQKRSFVISRSPCRTAKTKPSCNILPCVLPTNKIWLEWKGRYALPEEKMSVQGFLPGSFLSGGLPPTAFSKLAGNAVSLTVANAVNYAVLKEFVDIL